MAASTLVLGEALAHLPWSSSNPRYYWSAIFPSTASHAITSIPYFRVHASSAEDCLCRSLHEWRGRKRAGQPSSRAGGWAAVRRWRRVARLASSLAKIWQTGAVLVGEPVPALDEQRHEPLPLVVVTIRVANEVVGRRDGWGVVHHVVRPLCVRLSLRHPAAVIQACRARSDQLQSDPHHLDDDSRPHDEAMGYEPPMSDRPRRRTSKPTTS